jgi:hypothetical protein
VGWEGKKAATRKAECISSSLGAEDPSLLIQNTQFCGGQRGEVAQTMYTHMNKCINNKKMKKNEESLLTEFTSE